MTALDEVAAQVRAVSDRARILVDRAGTERLCAAPPGGGWSIAECFEHLNMSTRAFLPRWRQAFAEAQSRGLRHDGPYTTDLWGRLLVWTLEPPPKFRMPTTPPFQKFAAPPVDQVLNAFLACQSELLAALDAGRGLALDRVKIRSPFQEKMRYSVWSSFRITTSHQRRHLWQAERAERVLSP